MDDAAGSSESASCGSAREATIALAQGDLRMMDKEESLSKAQPDLEVSIFFRHGDIAASHGQLRQAAEFYDKASQVSKRFQVKSAEAFAEWVIVHCSFQEAEQRPSLSLHLPDQYS